MTKQEIYENIVQLTTELETTGVAVDIFEAAKTGDIKAVENVFITFEEENHELYQKIAKFGEEFNGMITTGNEAAIFGTEENVVVGIYVFDANKIDALSFYVLTFFAEIDELFLFTEWEDDCNSFLNALEEAGYEELADYIGSQSWIDNVGPDGDYMTLPELLVDLFE